MRAKKFMNEKGKSEKHGRSGRNSAEIYTVYEEDEKRKWPRMTGHKT